MQRGGRRRFFRPARRALGVAILAVTLLPGYRLLALSATGPAATQVLRLGRQYFIAQWTGLVLAVLLAAMLSRLLHASILSRLFGLLDRWLVRPSAVRVGAALGAGATALSAWVTLGVLQGQPVLLDGVAQLVQARYFAAGRLSGPALPDPAFWQFQFMVPTDSGWVSQYPPGFPAVLSLFWNAGAVWLAGPLLLGVTVWLTTLAADRIFPERRPVARAGAALLAVSWFLAFHAGSYMNHVLATLLVAVAVYASLRALQGAWAWAVLSGVAFGGIFATRPLVALVLGGFATVLVWTFPPEGRRLSAKGWLLRMAAAGLGAAPFLAASFFYQRRIFGGVLRFGYLVASGPAQGLGFHVDPWGSRYGLAEAVGFTSADLLGMSLDLLQTPIPIVVLVGAWLVFSRRIGRGAALAAAWALLPVLANGFYWHHDLFMGPRLLYESAPGWCLAVAVSLDVLLRGLPEDHNGSEDQRRGFLGRLLTRPGVAATLVVAFILGVAVAGPSKVASYGVAGRAMTSIDEPPAVSGPTLAFVHDDWDSRLGARMSALGMRLDSVRAALLHNSSCTVEEWVTARERQSSEGRGPAPDRMSPTAPNITFDGLENAPLLRTVTMPSGATIRTFSGELLTSFCEQQAASDYGGVVALAPLLWQGDLPGLGGKGAMFVRDLGPERNAHLIAIYADREPAVVIREGMQPPRLVPYPEGMEKLWRSTVPK